MSLTAITDTAYYSPREYFKVGSLKENLIDRVICYARSYVADPGRARHKGNDNVLRVVTYHNCLDALACRPRIRRGGGGARGRTGGGEGRWAGRSTGCLKPAKHIPILQLHVGNYFFSWQLNV